MQPARLTVADLKSLAASLVARTPGLSHIDEGASALRVRIDGADHLSSSIGIAIERSRNSSGLALVISCANSQRVKNTDRWRCQTRRFEEPIGGGFVEDGLLACLKSYVEQARIAAELRTARAKRDAAIRANRTAIQARLDVMFPSSEARPRVIGSGEVDIRLPLLTEEQAIRVLRALQGIHLKELKS